MGNKHVYEVFIGTQNCMERYAFGYARIKALNPKTMRYVGMDKGVSFKAIPDGITETGYKLMADTDIRAIAKEKGYIL